MSLRTYPLIVHPAFLAFVEHQKGVDHGLHQISPVQTPLHRPEIRSVTDIADYLQISHFFLRSILRAPHKHYRSFHFKKRSGGLRQINSPRTFLKVVQWWILDTILYNTEIEPVAHGFVKQKSFITNAREHVGARHILNVDVEDFFPSLKATHVSQVFSGMGYSASIASHLARLTTFNNCLPQGAPTSPAIANIALKEFDRAISLYAQELGLRYTRYADDITVSSSKFINSDVLGFISSQLSLIGLHINERKTRFMGPNDEKEVTGLVLGSSDVRLPRDTLNAARGWFHRIKVNPSQYKGQNDRIRGTLSLIRQVGGAGSASVAALGSSALMAIEQASFTSTNSDLP